MSRDNDWVVRHFRGNLELRSTVFPIFPFPVTVAFVPQICLRPFLIPKTVTRFFKVSSAVVSVLHLSFFSSGTILGVSSLVSV